MIKNVVILAAGRGNRISRSAGGVPKPLLPLSGKIGDATFLDYHLLCLDRLGCEQAVLVGNEVTFESPLQVQAKGLLKNLKIQWVLNPTEDLTTSGSAHSAQFAWNEVTTLLAGQSWTVLMDADIVYDPKLWDKLNSHTTQAQQSISLVCTRFRDSQEEVVVYQDNQNRPRLLGKSMVGSQQSKQFKIAGEATGIVAFAPADQSLVKEITDWCINTSSAKARSEHEDISARLMLLGKMDVLTFGEEYFFMECDTPEEYEVLKSEMYPKIKQFYAAGMT
jgi:choline kinase